jgi:hypothetical protein
MDVEKNPGCMNDEQYFIWLAVWHRDFIDELEKPPCLFSSLTSTLTLTLLAGGHAQTSGIYLIYLLDQEQRHTSTSSNLASKGLRSCVLLKLHPHPTSPPPRLTRRRPPQCRALAELPMQSCHHRIALRLIVFCTVNNNEFELIISSPAQASPLLAIALARERQRAMLSGLTNFIT